MDAMTHRRRVATTLVALILAVAMAGSPAVSAKTRVPASRDEIRLSFAPLVKRVAPAVVNIYAKRVVRSRPISPLFDDPMFRRFFGDRFSFGQPRERVQNSLGSGVLVRPGGYTRVLRAGFRYGDSAPMALIELVDRDAQAKGQDSGPVQSVAMDEMEHADVTA